MNLHTYVLPLAFMAGLGFIGSTTSLHSSHRSDSELPEALEAKLQRQWQRYRDTQTHALHEFELTKKPVSRTEWESSLDTKAALTTEDLEELRHRQDTWVEQARVANRNASVLDLDELRSKPLARVREFCERFPKGGMLHIHPWGSVSRNGVEKILSLVNPKLGAKTLHDAFLAGTAGGTLYPAEIAFLSELDRRYGKAATYSNLSEADRFRLRELLFLSQGAHEFPRFEAVFTLMRVWFRDNPAIEADTLIHEDIFRRAKAQHVDYVELTDGIRMESSWVNHLDDWAKEIHARYGITVRLLASFGRLTSPDKMLERAYQLLSLPASEILLGINLVADETNAPALEQGQMLYLPVQAAVASGKSLLRRTIHAGELGDVRNVRDSLLLGAERIGHGVKLIQDRVTLELARRQKTPVEVNLNSNLRLKVIADFKEHPFLYYQRLGLRVSLSTDDEGILGTDMNHECVTAITTSDMSYQELRDMALNSLETAFARHGVIDPLRKKLLEDLAVFEQSWQSVL